MRMDGFTYLVTTTPARVASGKYAGSKLFCLNIGPAMAGVAGALACLITCRLDPFSVSYIQCFIPCTQNKLGGIEASYSGDTESLYKGMLQ